MDIFICRLHCLIICQPVSLVMFRGETASPGFRDCACCCCLLLLLRPARVISFFGGPPRAEWPAGCPVIRCVAFA